MNENAPRIEVLTSSLILRDRFFLLTRWKKEYIFHVCGYVCMQYMPRSRQRCVEYTGCNEEAHYELQMTKTGMEGILNALKVRWIDFLFG